MTDRTEVRDAFGLDADPHKGHPPHDGTGLAHQHGSDESNDHLASIYESNDEQFAAVVPFVRRGLERGERCLYVADDNGREEVLDAFRDGGIDVEAALDSGALSVHTKEDTYVRTGEFDREAMVEFWRDALAEARDENGYAGVRAAAEMTWVLDEETSFDRLVEYEATLNEIYPGDDYVVMCQYDREQFPADVLSDVVRTHPLVVYDGTVCRNVHYNPPEEFFGSDASRRLERMMDGLLDRAEREHRLQRQNDRLKSFADMLAHELRNPLAIAEIYLQRAAEGDEDAVAEVERAHERIEEMIDVLLVTARGDDSVVDWEAVSLSDAAEEAWRGLPTGSATLSVETASTVRADRVHLRHLLENLFDNALEHGGDGVTVRVGDLRESDESDVAGFYVEDDGRGIPEGERETVFEAGQTTHSGGTGLGLAFVEQLAKVYGWNCDLTESDDGGTRFEFRDVELASTE